MKMTNDYIYLREWQGVASSFAESYGGTGPPSSRLREITADYGGTGPPSSRLREITADKMAGQVRRRPAFVKLRRTMAGQVENYGIARS
jgi:hypothetical protein